MSTLINIIKLSLWNKPYENPSLISFSYKEWIELYDQACYQGLAAIFIDGVDKLEQKSKACQKFLSNEGVQAVIGSEAQWLEQKQVLMSFSTFLHNHGLKTLLIKGLGLSLYYPNPKHRECGDIDIYLFGHYDEGNRIAEQELGGMVEAFSMKEDHIVIGNISIDNHKDFLWTNNDKNREIDRYLKRLLQDNLLPKFIETEILLPTAEFNFLFLMVHSYGHFMREGMPLRQITDIACFLKENEKKLDWQKCEQTLQKFRLKKFADGIIAFIEYYFGLSFVYSPKVNIELLKMMMNDIIGHSHAVVYHKSRIASKLYIARTSWKNRWRYNAFYEGGYRKFVFESLKRITLSLPHLGAL